VADALIDNRTFAIRREKTVDVGEGFLDSLVKAQAVTDRVESKNKSRRTKQRCTGPIIVKNFNHLIAGNVIYQAAVVGNFQDWNSRVGIAGFPAIAGLYTLG